MNKDGEKILETFRAAYTKKSIAVEIEFQYWAENLPVAIVCGRRLAAFWDDILSIAK